MTDERTDEQRIARVLDRLRLAEPLPGMEARVLKRMLAERQSEAAPEDTGRWWRRFTEPNMAPRRKIQPAWAIAGMAGVLLLGGGLLWRMPRTSPRAGSAPQVRKETPERDENKASYAGQTHTLQAGTATVTTARTPCPAHDRQSLGLANVALRQQPSSLVRSDAAESFPAPPMPLTRQERLLLRMLSAGERTSLVATLSAGAEQAMSLHETVSRREFFTPKWPETAQTEGAFDGEELPDAVGHGALTGKPLDRSNLQESQNKEKR